MWVFVMAVLLADGTTFPIVEQGGLSRLNCWLTIIDAPPRPGIVYRCEREL